MRLRLVPSKDWRGRIEFRLACSDGLPTDLTGINLAPRAGTVVTIRHAAGDQAGEAVVSLGPANQLILDCYRRAGGGIANWLMGQPLSPAGVRLDPPADLDLAGALQALAEGLLLGSYRFEKYKRVAQSNRVGRIDILIGRRTRQLSQCLPRADSVGAGVIIARDLAHEPPNVINPVSLARRVRSLADKHGLKCRVLDQRQMQKLKMGAMLAVGKGSATAPRLIVLEYGGTRARAQQPVVLVGKAITFDTGGYSVKTPSGMIGMKYDKCGGMTVIGAMIAIARCRPSRPVVGIIAAAENMISDKAYRPDDIITTMSGKTVEIVSADAEGRLVLADALTYAQRKYRPRALIDLATLTGGVTVTLGSAAAAVMSNDDTLQEHLLDAGRRTRERLWPLPLWDDYDELISGDDSDLKNSAGRPAQTIVGGIFLKQFVSPTVPWAHLDIAGVARTAVDLPYCVRGATGFGVRLLTDYLVGAAR